MKQRSRTVYMDFWDWYETVPIDGQKEACKYAGIRWSDNTLEVIDDLRHLGVWCEGEFIVDKPMQRKFVDICQEWLDFWKDESAEESFFKSLKNF